VTHIPFGNMSKLVPLVLAFLPLCQGEAHAGYPTTFPITVLEENPVLPTTAPNFAYDPLDKDDGGYTRTYAEFCEMEDAVFPFSWYVGVCPYITYFTVTLYQVPAEVDLGNCSEYPPISADAFTEELVLVAGDKICDPEECCKEYYGLPMARDLAGGVITYTKAIPQELCPTMPHVTYCGEMVYPFWCNEMYPSAASRYMDVLGPCYDYTFLWNLECKATVVVGPTNFNFEPVAYWDGLTPLQAIKTYSIWLYPDRVCHPYEYFHPEAVSPDSGGDASPQDDAPEDDDSAALVMALAPLAAMAAIM